MIPQQQGRSSNKAFYTHLGMGCECLVNGERVPVCGSSDCHAELSRGISRCVGKESGERHTYSISRRVVRGRKKERKKFQVRTRSDRMRCVFVTLDMFGGGRFIDPQINVRQ